MSRTVTLVILALEAAVYLALCRSTASQSSATYDESDHLMAGYIKLRRADFRFVPEHPHLAQTWAALPLSFMSIRQPWDCGSPEQWRRADIWPIAEEWMGRANSPARLLDTPRLMISLLGLVLGLAVVAVAWRMGGTSCNADPAAPAAAQARGRCAAVAAGGIFALCPTMIAHGSVVTTDLAAALGVFAASLALLPLMVRPGIFAAVLAGIGCGVALMLKFSVVLAVPGVAAWWLHSAWRRAAAASDGGQVHQRRFGRFLGRLARDIPFLVTAAVCAWCVVWACFGFRYRAAPDDVPDARFFVAEAESTVDPWATVLSEAGWRGRLAPLARRYRLLPEAFVWGTSYAPFMIRGRASYFMGQTRLGGSPAYFPVLFLLKTPLPVLIILGVGAARLARRAARRERPDAERVHQAPRSCDAGEPAPSRFPTHLASVWAVGAACIVAAYAVNAVAADFNIGQRHLTPIYPFLFVAGGLTAARMWLGARGDRLGLAVLGGWLVVGAWRAHPNELAYFNEAIIRSENAAYVAVDSNIDWGQDVKKLGQLQRERGWPEIKFSYFGSCDPAAYGVRAAYLPSQVAPMNAKPATVSAGVYAISLTCLRLAVINSGTEPWLNDWTPAVGRVYAELTQKAARAQRDPAFVMSADDMERWNNLLIARLFTRLRERPPDATAGRSIYVYEIDGDELARLTAP